MNALAPLHRRRHLAAFTMIELMMVLILMGIFMAVVATSAGMGQGPAYKLRERSRRVAGLMEQSLIRANSRDGMVKILYDFDEQEIMMMVPPELEEDEARPDPEDIEYERRWVFSIGDPDDEEGSQVWLDAVQTLDGKMHSRGIYEVLIARSGTSMGHIVHLRSNDGSDSEDFSIEMNPLTGKAHIYQYRKEVEEPEKD